MSKSLSVFVLAITILLGACAESGGPGTKQTIGGLSGVALGGFLGSQFGSGTGQPAFTAAGVVLGALLGSEVGRNLDEADRVWAHEANRRAHRAHLGETITWNNPDSGNFGSIMPLRDGTAPAGSTAESTSRA